MKILLEDVEPGMILACDLMHEGLVLLKNGAEISEQVIDLLRNRGVKVIDVIVSADANESDPDDVGAAVPSFENDPAYLKNKEEINSLFATQDREDAQMDMLQECILSELRERYNDNER